MKTLTLLPLILYIEYITKNTCFYYMVTVEAKHNIPLKYVRITTKHIAKPKLVNCTS